MGRWGAALALGVWIALAVLVAGSRWLGQRAASPGFPLPQADGCWQGVCFFELAPDAIPATLNAHPGVVPGSARRVLNPAAPGEQRVRFLVRRGGRVYSVELVHDAASYYLAPEAPWLRLGDVVTALGAPERVTLLADQIGLHYPAQSLVVFVLHRGAGPAPRLAPSDAVVGLAVLRREPVEGESRVYYPPSSAWRGFGVYHFED